MRPSGETTPPRAGRRARRLWVGVAALLGLAALAYVVTLPIRQTPYSVRDHAIVEQANGTAIEGVLRNRGDGVATLLVEAYLYDTDGRYLATSRRTYRDVTAHSTTPIRLPIDPALASRVGRYSLYIGTGPNPFAPAD